MKCNDVTITVTHDSSGNEISSFHADIPEQKQQSWWEKVKSWLSFHDVKPYADVIDLNNPSNLPEDHDNPPKPAAEIGIKLTF